jgi:hypothetical protein
MEENVIVITSLGEGSEILASLERRLDLETELHCIGKALYFWCMVIV